MTTVNLSLELSENLQKIAQEEDFSLDELVESVLGQYLIIIEDEELYRPEPEELAALLEAVEEYEAEEAAGKLVSQEEMNLMLNRLVKDHERKQKKASA